MNSPPPKPEVILTNFFAEPTVLLVPITSRVQATTQCKYYEHIVLLYLESRRCRYRSIIFACLYLYVYVVNLIDYSDIDKMMDINNEKC